MLRLSRMGSRQALVNLVLAAHPDTLMRDSDRAFTISKYRQRGPLLATKRALAYKSWDEPILTLDKLNDLSNLTLNDPLLE